MVFTVLTDRPASAIVEFVSGAPEPPVCVKVQVLLNGTRRLTFQEPLSPDVLEKLEEYGCTPDDQY